MPKRTNPFQELVALIQRALAPRGAKLTESALVNEPWMPETREIDILIEAPVGPIQIKIAVEAKDEGRKMDSTKFETLLGKYLVDGGIRGYKVVVITHRGFFKPVIERAKRLGIDLFTLDQAFEVDWASQFPPTLRFSHPLHVCGITFEPAIPHVDTKAVLQEGQVVCCHGNHGSLAQYASQCLSRDVAPRYPNLAALLVQAAQQNGEAVTRVNLQLDHHPFTLRFRGKDHPLSLVSFNYHVVSGEGKMKYSEHKLTPPEGPPVVLQCAEAVVGSNKITIMMPDGMKSDQIVIKINDTTATAPRKA